MNMKLLRLFLLGSFLGASLAAPRWAAAQEGEAPAASDEEEAPKPKPKKKPKKKKGYDYDKSQYKAFRVDPEPSSYKFGADGKPISDKKKKTVKKKIVSTPEDEIDGIVPAEDCGSDDSCKEPVKS